MDDLIGLIYETIADPTIWGEVTRLIAKEVSADSYWMFRIASDTPDFFALQNLSKTMLDVYSAEYHKRDVLMKEEVRRAREFAGRAVREQDIIGERAWQESEIYFELARPNGMHRILSMNLTSAPSEGMPFLTFFRPSGAPAFQQENIDACGQLISHMRRAIRLADVAETRSCPIPRWTEKLLDQLEAGIALLDAHGRILHANRSFMDIVNKRDGLFIQNGKVLAKQISNSENLNANIEACCRGTPLETEMVVNRIDGEWLVSISPLLGSSQNGLIAQRCRAWIWISDPVKDAKTLSMRLGKLFGLTPAEQRVAIALMDNFLPTDIASAHGVSINTVRTQVQHIYGKLGVRRQLELSRLLRDVSTLPLTQS